jgi:hypothetical protein
LHRRAGYLYKLRKQKIARAGELNKRAGWLNERAGEKLCDRGRRISGQGGKLRPRGWHDSRPGRKFARVRRLYRPKGENSFLPAWRSECGERRSWRRGRFRNACGLELMRRGDKNNSPPASTPCALLQHFSSSRFRFSRGNRAWRGGFIIRINPMAARGACAP